MTLQLSIDGREVPLEVIRARGKVRRRLTSAQAAIMRQLREVGEIRSFQAGMCVHEARGSCAGAGGKWTGWTGKGKSCCPYAATDGLMAMHRLAARGLAYRDPNELGRWLVP